MNTPLAAFPSLKYIFKKSRVYNALKGFTGTVLAIVRDYQN